MPPTAPIVLEHESRDRSPASARVTGRLLEIWGGPACEDAHVNHKVAHPPIVIISTGRQAGLARSGERIFTAAPLSPPGRETVMPRQLPPVVPTARTLSYQAEPTCWGGRQLPQDRDMIFYQRTPKGDLAVQRVARPACHRANAAAFHGDGPGARLTTTSGSTAASAPGNDGWRPPLPDWAWYLRSRKALAHERCSAA